MCAGGLGIAASTVNSPSPLPGCDTRSTISSPVSTAGATRSRTWPSAVSIATSSEGLNGLDLWQETENGKISEPRMQYGWNTDKKAGQLPQLITIVILVFISINLISCEPAYPFFGFRSVFHRWLKELLLRYFQGRVFDRWRRNKTERDRSRIQRASSQSSEFQGGGGLTLLAP